jgi:ferredoxin
MYCVSVDRTHCQGHAHCVAFAPEVFESDDEGYSFVPDEKRQQAQLTRALRFALASCPEHSIQVKDD